MLRTFPRLGRGFYSDAHGHPTVRLKQIRFVPSMMYRGIISAEIRRSFVITEHLHHRQDKAYGSQRMPPDSHIVMRLGIQQFYRLRHYHGVMLEFIAENHFIH
jgi:hypothetical protein